MKAKKVLLVVSMMFCFRTSSAQIFKLRNNAGSDTYFGLVKWSDRKLRWDDFKGHKPATMSKKASYISLKSMPVEQKKEIDGIYYKLKFPTLLKVVLNRRNRCKIMVKK